MSGSPARPEDVIRPTLVRLGGWAKASARWSLRDDANEALEALAVLLAEREEREQALTAAKREETRWYERAQDDTAIRLAAEARAVAAEAERDSVLETMAALDSDCARAEAELETLRKEVNEWERPPRVTGASRQAAVTVQGLEDESRLSSPAADSHSLTSSDDPQPTWDQFDELYDRADRYRAELETARQNLDATQAAVGRCNEAYKRVEAERDEAQADAYRAREELKQDQIRVENAWEQATKELSLRMDVEAELETLRAAAEEVIAELRARASLTNLAGQIEPPYTAHSLLSMADLLARAVLAGSSE